MSQLNEAIVKKSWGYEYLAFRNENLAIWFLHIDFMHETSMHCHCRKETGLIVLDGLAEVSFINNSVRLKGLDKIQIFQRRFHSTKAISRRGISLLEVEAPEDKLDLVRIKDKYGRVGMAYEGPEFFSKKDEKCLELGGELPAYHSGCTFNIQTIRDKSELIEREFEEIIVILTGGIESFNHDLICPPGCVMAAHNFSFLLENLNLIENTQILVITKNAEH